MTDLGLPAYTQGFGVALSLASLASSFGLFHEVVASVTGLAMIVLGYGLEKRRGERR